MVHVQKTPLLGDNKLLSLLRSLNKLAEGTREAEVIRPVERECTQKPRQLFLVVSPSAGTKAGPAGLRWFHFNSAGILNHNRKPTTEKYSCPIVKSHFLVEVGGGLRGRLCAAVLELGRYVRFPHCVAPSVYLRASPSAWRSEVIVEQGRTGFNLTCGLWCLLSASSSMWFVFVYFEFSLSWKLWSDWRGSVGTWHWNYLDCWPDTAPWGPWWYCSQQAPSSLTWSKKIWCSSVETTHFLHKAAAWSVLRHRGSDSRIWVAMMNVCVIHYVWENTGLLQVNICKMGGQK